MSRTVKKEAPPEAVDDVDELARLIMTWIHLSMQRNAVQRQDGGDAQRIEMDAGLTMPQHQALHMLMYEGGCSVSALTKKLGMSMSAVSHLAQRLVEMGYVARDEDPADRRQKQLSLAPAGKKLVERLMKARFKEMRASVEHLSAPLKRDLKGVLERVVTEMSARASKDASKADARTDPKSDPKSDHRSDHKSDRRPEDT